MFRTGMRSGGSWPLAIERMRTMKKEMNEDFKPKVLLREGLVVVGCDPSSTRNCGWGVVKFEGGMAKLLAKFTLEITREQNDIGRYKDVYDAMQTIHATHRPSVLCIERSMGGGLQFVRNNLSETVGVLKLCCHNLGINCHEMSPAHLKKIFAGHGRAKKKDMKANVVATFDLKKAGAEHECDAVALAVSYFIDAGWADYKVKVPFVP